MKNLLLCIPLLFLVGCKDALKKESLPNSFGDYDNVLVVMDDKLWYGSTGDSIRNYLASFIVDVEPAESQYMILQFSPRLLDAHYKKFRNIIVFSDNHNDINFTYESNKFADPQNYFVLTAMNRDELVNVFAKHYDSINSIIHKTEIEKYIASLRLEKVHNKEVLAHPFDIELDLPVAFKLVKKGKDFIWFKKEMASGSSSIMVYSIPIGNIENKDNSVFKSILHVKDSVNRMYIHSSEHEALTAVDEKYLPFHERVVLNGKEGIVLYGKWDMVNSFMSGPYLTYIFRDEEIDRYVFIEGLVYNPSMSKRRMLTELEAIIKTIQFK